MISIIGRTWVPSWSRYAQTVNSLPSIHSCTRGRSWRVGKCLWYFSSHQTFMRTHIRSSVSDFMVVSTDAIPSSNCLSVFAFVAPSELPHWFGFMISVISRFSVSFFSFPGRSFGGSGSPGIQLFGILTQSFSTTQFVWNLSIQSACTPDGHHATLIPRVSHIPVMMPSSPYRPWNTGITKSKILYFERKVSISRGRSKLSHVCPAISTQSFILAPLRSATSRSVEIPQVSIAICIGLFYMFLIVEKNMEKTKIPSKMLEIC